MRQQLKVKRLLIFTRRKIMKYFEITITTENIEEAAGRLAMLDIFEYQIEDPADIREILDNKNMYDWDFADEEKMAAELGSFPRIKVYAEDKVGADKIAHAFEGFDVEIAEVDDEEWKNKYKEHFKSLYLTRDILVCPSWEETPDEAKKVIYLDPGMAFGTGDHGTTSMCAGLMEQYGCAGKKVMDVGTGSGILAIAAYLMDAEDILGIDIDETAVSVAKENIEKNGCEDKVEIRIGDLTEGVDYEADMVVANIIAELVIKLAEGVKNHLVPGGKFISSGILVEKSDMVANALLDLGFVIDDINTDGEWCAIGAHYE